jgi:hypothetical protein
MAPRAPQLPPSAYAFAYLCTGTSLALMGQVVTNQGAFDPSTQLVALNKYTCTFLLSSVLQAVAHLGSRKPSGSAAKANTKGDMGQAAVLTLLIGWVVGYSSAANATHCERPAAVTVLAGCLLQSARHCQLRAQLPRLRAVWRVAEHVSGDARRREVQAAGTPTHYRYIGTPTPSSCAPRTVFASCGQLFTAVARRALLRKGMTAGQALGVLLVAAGGVGRGGGRGYGHAVGRVAAVGVSKGVLVGRRAASAGCRSVQRSCIST